MAMIVEPGKYLMVLSREQLGIILRALNEWGGPCPEGGRTPTEIEYEKKSLDQAADMAKDIMRVLGTWS